MRVLAPLALATLLAACSEPPCQELGTKLCSCTGLSTESCKTKVEDDLRRNEMSDATCEGYLETCDSSSRAADFCEWLLTEEGKSSCGITN